MSDPDQVLAWLDTDEGWAWTASNFRQLPWYLVMVKDDAPGGSPVLLWQYDGSHPVWSVQDSQARHAIDHAAEVTARLRLHYAAGRLSWDEFQDRLAGLVFR